MAYYGSYHNEYIFREYDPAPYDNHDDISGINEELLPSLDTIFHPLPIFYPNSPSQEGFFYGSVSLPYEKEEADFTSRTQNENGLTGCENWPSEYNFCSGGCWGEDFFSHGHGACNNGYDSGLEKTEDFYQSEEQCDSYYSYCEGVDERPACDYNPWSGYGSGFGYREEDDSCDHGRQELNPSYGYSQDGLGLCEAVFGYWPCLFWNDWKSYGEDGANERRYGYTLNRSAEYI